MTRFVILAPRDRAAEADISRGLRTPRCCVSGEIAVRGSGNDALDQLPRDPACLYVETERGGVYRADPSGILYKGDIIALLGFPDIAQAYEGATYRDLVVGSLRRMITARVIAGALKTGERRIIEALFAGAPIQMSRKDVVTVLIGALGYASDLAGDHATRGDALDPDSETLFSDIIGGLDVLSQALCA